jgi:hypothetical protein
MGTYLNETLGFGLWFGSLPSHSRPCLEDCPPRRDQKMGLGCTLRRKSRPRGQKIDLPDIPI